MKTTGNYQDGLKLLMIITMIIDHLGGYLFQDQFWMRMIGRSAMPLFCFFAGYNFKSKPHISILIFGVILHLITLWVFKRWVLTNILISIYAGQCYLYFFKNKLNRFNIGYLHVIVLASLAPFNWLYIDYGSLVAAIMVLGYMTKNDNNLIKATAFITIILSLLHTFAVFPLTKYHIIMVLAVYVIEYLLMIIKDFKETISFNLVGLISRNSLYIYFLHLAIIQIIWRQYFLL